MAIVVNAVKVPAGFRARILLWTKGRTSAMATVQTLSTNLFILGLNVLTGVITAHALGPAGRGEQAAMVLWPPFFANLLTLGLPSALVYNLKRTPQARRELFSVALWLASALGLIAALVGILILPFQLTQYPAGVLFQARFIVLLTPTTLVALVLNGALQASDDFPIYNRVRYLSPVLTLVLLVLLAITHRLTPFSSSFAIAFAGTPVFFWLLVRLCREYRPELKLPRRAIETLLNYGLRSYGVDILSQLSLTLDQVLVVKFLAPRAMGMYVVALSLSRMLNVFQTSVVNVLFPKAAGRTKQEVVLLTGRVMRVSTVLTAGAAIVVSLICPFLLKLLYGPQFLGAVAVFRIFVVEVVVGSIIAVLGQAFMALGRPGLVTVLQTLGLGLSLPLMVVLIPRYGLTGAGLAILFSTGIRLIFILTNFPISLKVPPPSLVLNRSDIVWVRGHLRK